VTTERYVMTLRCNDAPGVIHAVSGALLEIGGNVLEQAQFTNESTGMFAMRTRFESTNTEPAEVHAAIEGATQGFAPQLTVRLESELPRVLIMVSQYDHCLVDLLYRQAAGEIPMDVPVIVSNHRVCEPIAEQYGIPFRYIPLEKGVEGAKEAAEDRLREVMAEFDIDAVVLARYMQILSDRLCQDLQGRAINIHHSFLPGFKGARPYHQAYDRGVKLIGATAHFVTADLDEGPIIEQGVERVEHHHTADELARIGRDIERLVLARAVTLFVEDRVLLEGHRTVVFS
jgi:formyltetrahydrofolate deformylase